MGLEIQSVFVGVEIMTRQSVCFVWTFRDQLHLNLVYSESFDDEKDMAMFLTNTQVDFAEGTRCAPLEAWVH